MNKKKLTAMLALMLVCGLLFSIAALAYSQEGGDQAAESRFSEASINSEDPEQTSITASEAEKDPYSVLQANPDVRNILLAGLDSETLQVLKEHPQMISMILPTLHITVADGSVIISTDDGGDSGRFGTVTTQGGNLNVRTGAGTGYSIITQLLNGTSVKVLGEKDGWYQIEIPPGFGYVCGQYLKVNNIPAIQTGDGYSFDLDGTSLLSFLQIFHELADSAGSIYNRGGLTPSGNLTLVDDYGERTGEGQQFVTLVTKNGNYFYLVIDRDEKGEENVHFLNMVDERDLFALMEEDEAAEYQAQLAAEQVAREAAERAAAEAAAAAQAGESETQKPDDKPERESKKTSIAPILIIIVLLVAAGGGWFFLQTQKKKQAASAPDPDADYSEDDDEDYGAGPETGYPEPDGREDPYEDEVFEDEDNDDDMEVTE